MIAGEERARGDFARKELVDGGPALRGVRRVRSRTGVERVPIEDQVADTLHDGAQLLEPVHAAGVIAIMEV